jgi:hypothetical protein
MERMSRKDLVGLLARAVGEDSGFAVVDQACAKLGIAAPDFTFNVALDVLEVIAQRDDLIGIAARFAKARLRGRARQSR